MKSETKNSLEKIAKKVGLTRADLFFYGEEIAKIRPETYEKFVGKNDGKSKKIVENFAKNSNKNSRKNGKLILVTAISPTPAGEGKTTISIGLADAINRISRKSGRKFAKKFAKKRAILALREPSMGPVFGMKGGAIGGGKSRLTPGEEINLHFTGDFHAITSANNLLAALIDNHIYFGNSLNIDPEKIVFKRCLDVNDRALREFSHNSAGEFSAKSSANFPDRFREFSAGFNITAASEIMAILALAENLTDLKKRISRMLVAFSRDGKPIFAHDLAAENALTILLKNALNPNLVRTLDGTLALVHAGPFANIAHGCSSVRATKMALKLGDYVITEAGFGADLGAEKFLDVKMRAANLWPDLTVLVATIRALKFSGGAEFSELEKPDFAKLEIGLDNLKAHVKILKKFGLPVVVAINKFASDTDEEIDFVKNFAKNLGVDCEVADMFSRESSGGENGENLAKIVMKIAEKSAENSEKSPKFIYDLADSAEEKIAKIAREIYGANEKNPVEFSENARKFLTEIRENPALDFAKNLPVVIAKTQYSLSDDPKKLAKNLRENPDFTVKIREIEIDSGAGFLVATSGKIYRMPGLPKIPASTKMTIDARGKVDGIK